MQEYDKELSKITNDLFMPTDGSVETLEKVDKAYGTNYKKAGMGVQEYANKVLKKGSKASPAMKKKANFARNAAKWKH